MRLPRRAELARRPGEPCAVEGHTLWAQASARRSGSFTDRTRREPHAPRNPVQVRRDKQSAAMESPGLRRSRKISHRTLCNLINTLLSVQP